MEEDIRKIKMGVGAIRFKPLIKKIEEETWLKKEHLKEMEAVEAGEEIRGAEDVRLRRKEEGVRSNG